MPNATARTETKPSVALQITERKSTAAVAEISSSFTPGQVVVREFGNLTFILSPASRLSLVDELGRQVTRFEAINNLAIVNWDELRAGEDEQQTYPYGKIPNPNKFSSITTNFFAGSRNANVRNITTGYTTDFQAFLEAYIKSKGQNTETAPIPERNWLVGDPGRTHQVVIENNFIILHEAGINDFVAYSIADSQGQPKPPHQWTRFDSKDEYLGRIPKPILNRIHNLREANKAGVKYTKPVLGFNLIVQDDKITAVKSGDSISQAEFTDNAPLVKDNVCIDPQDPSVVYYCSSANASWVCKLTMTGEPSTWKTEHIPIPTAYTQIASLQLDPTGSAFMFETGSEVVIVEKNSFKELKRLPLKKAIFDQQGKIRGVDGNGRFVTAETNLEQVAKEVRRRDFMKRAAGIDVQGLFQATTPEATAEEAVAPGLDTEVLLPIRLQQEANFLKMLTRVQSLEEATKSGEVLQTLRGQLLDRGFSEAQVAFLTQGMAEAITLRQQVFAQHEAGKMIKVVEPQIDPAFLSTATIQDVHKTIDSLNALSGFLDTDTRNTVVRLTQKFNFQVAELYRRQGETIQTDLGNTVAGLRARLDQMHSRAELNDWREMDFPMLKEKLAMLANDCPIEAYEVQERIIQTRRDMEALVQSYEDKFRKEYAQIREKAADVIADKVAVLGNDIDGFISRMADRKFPSVEEARAYISTAESRAFIEGEIKSLATHNLDRATEFSRALKVKIANLYSEINRAANVRVSETGEQMEPFGPQGKVLFPIWEQKVKGPEVTHKRQVSLIFIPDEKSKGPEVTFDKISGDVGVMYIDAKGKPRKVRLFEGDMYEDLWRYGQLTKAKHGIPHTYMTQVEFVQLKQEFDRWEKPTSPLMAEFNQKKNALLTHLKTRPKDQPVPMEWNAELARLSSTYNQFVAEHSTIMMILSRVNKIRNTPEESSLNGKGYVPQMENHWVVDKDTEETLAIMAKHFKGQLELKEGLLMLKGHAGTGKDVLVKIFCARAKRLYFGFDCSKWTTDEDLTQVILLDATDGGTKTIKIPSAVLNAIQTPGAVLYFNEYNTMPEDTQIFLNSLLDEKRSITLKTESGKTIKADPSLLIAASMNPGYKGTSELQRASRTRMVEMEIGYPPLLDEIKPGDTNPNKPYSSSEALRIARGVDSLTDLTLNQEDFVQVWDHEVNLMDNGAPALNPIQAYDLKVVLALVQFGDKLRQEFIQIEEKVPGTHPLPVTLPITGREMRRAAYALSQVPETTKQLQTINPEAMARNLIETYFLCHFDKTADKNKIKTSMGQWRSAIRQA